MSVEDLKKCQDMLDGIINEKNCGPILIRLAWHDSGTYDVALKDEEWPKAGGACASIRFAPEINHGANAGLAGVVTMLEPVKEAFPSISYADIYQMASARAVALMGGPTIDMIYGRQDATAPTECSPEGNLPDAEPAENGKYGGTSGTASTEDTTPSGHLKKVFYRMGLNDEEIVALSGAHTVGRTHKDRSGLGAEETKFTDGKTVEQLRADGKAATYAAGGSSWTSQWLKFDNSYFASVKPDAETDPDLLKLSSDRCLWEDPAFKPWAEKFAESQEAFFESYAKSHKKLSELGSKFVPEGGIKM